MNSTITYQQARSILDQNLKTEYLKVHCRQTEVIMRKLAEYYKQDPEFWGITGLLHDLDLDIINGDFQRHGYETVSILKNNDFDIPEMFEAIIAHAEGVPNPTGKRTKDFHFILAAAENITGLITAYVLMRPDKKIAEVEVSSVKKRLKEKRFAAAVNRDFIYDIEKTGLGIDEFLKISIDAMKEIADEI